ncbi:MAG: alpha/beta fold hydrolase [Nanoarchaeota archaeon]
MKKRVFIIHGWDGYPEEGWFPWLKKELEKRDFKVFVPSMPNSSKPDINKWVDFIREQVRIPDKETFFVGHSIGCQASLRYLESLNVDSKVGGAVFVAGWFSLTSKATPTNEEKRIAKPWIETPINFEKVKKISKNMIAISSNNDPYVPLSNVEIFKNKLNAKIIIEKEKGHFSGEEGITKLPIVLNSLLGMIQK